MATVTTSTSSLNVEVSYVCSICGTPNVQQTTIQVQANSSEKSQAKMRNILTELTSDDLSKRYTHANLKCRCTKCKYSEPWADLDFYKLDALITVCGLIGGLVLLAGLTDPYSGMSMFGLLCLLAAGVIFVYKKFLAASSAKKIAALPPQSLPVIRVPRSTVPSQNDIMARIHERMNNEK